MSNRVLLLHNNKDLVTEGGGCCSSGGWGGLKVPIGNVKEVWVMTTRIIGVKSSL